MAFETLNSSTSLVRGSDNINLLHVQFSLPRFESITEYLYPSNLQHIPLDTQFIQSLLWCIVFLTSNLIFVYISTWISFTLQRLSQDKVKVPPTMPYMVPYVGNALSFAFDPATALARAR